MDTIGGKRIFHPLTPKSTKKKSFKILQSELCHAKVLTTKEVSFEWSHHHAHTKTLEQFFIIDSGSEGVKKKATLCTTSRVVSMQTKMSFITCIFLTNPLPMFFSLGPPSAGDHVSGLVLFHLKGITLCLDPLLYKWISYQSPSSTVSPRHKAERERTKSARHQSLTRTPSATTPRKKTFARGT